MARKIKIDKTMPKPRNAMAVIARQMRAVKFDHKAEERGGDRNETSTYLDEYLTDCEDDDCECD